MTENVERPITIKIGTVDRDLQRERLTGGAPAISATITVLHSLGEFQLTVPLQSFTGFDAEFYSSLQHAVEAFADRLKEAARSQFQSPPHAGATKSKNSILASDTRRS